MIPQEWDVKSFDDLFDFRNGVNAEKQAYGQGVPFINVLEPITYSHIYGPEISGRIMLSESLLNSYAVRHGDVLFNRTSETQEEVGLASAYLGSEQVVFGGFVICGRPKNDSLDPLYSGYALRAPSVRSQIIPMGQGAIRANISQHNLKLVLALVPAPAEQGAIATALRDVDELLKGIERLIAKKHDLKQAAMQQLLTGQTRLPGFIGEWETKKLGEMLTICHGKSQRGIETEDGIYPILATGGQIGSTNSYICDKPSVLIGRKGTIDQPQYMDTPFWTVDTLFYSNVKNGNSAKFLFYLFWRFDWKRYNEASGVPSLNAKTIEGIEAKCPEPHEQEAIATVLTDMDAELAALDQRLTKTRNLKQAMMQELLTGKTRLVTSEAIHA